MRVEPCGGLFTEPKEGDTFFQPHHLSEPISIINPKSNLLLEKEHRFSELNLVGDTVVINQKNSNLSSENKEFPLAVGFFLTEEEWSLFKQPHLGLEPYEQKKMGSLPKSFTPFTLAAVGDGTERPAYPNGTTTDSIWLRKCESLSATPSLSLVNENEPNNNTISNIPSVAKLVPHQKPQDVFQEEEEKENWIKSEKVNHMQPFVKLNNLVNNKNIASSGHEICQNDMFNQTSSLDNTFGGIDKNENMTMADFKSAGGGFGGFPSQMNSAVGTIGSHPQPIASISRDQCHTPSHMHYHQQPYKSAANNNNNNNVQNSSICPPISSSSYYGQDQDWHSQSLLWNNNSGVINEVEEAAIWNHNFGAAENVLEIASRQESHFPYVQPVSGRHDEMETLLTFLSKFDDKVAAIWGQEGAAAAAMAANIQYNTDGYLSSSSTTPVGVYPWGSPTSSDQPSGQGYYDLRVMQIQIEQQQRALAEQFYKKQYGHHQMDYPQAEIQSANRIAIGSSTIIPPKGKYTIMHSMKQHFGTAPSEADYHIVRKEDVGSSGEEKEKSLSLLNHDEEVSGFTRFLPEMHRKPEKQEILPPQVTAVVQESVSKYQPSEIDIKSMQDILSSLDLENEEELEIVAACKGDPKPFIEAPPQEDLLNSWKTHFTTIDVFESSDMNGQMASPVTTLSAHQINPNLPEFRLFDGNEQDYKVFQHLGKTMFPVRYKLRPDNEKSVQTEEIDEPPPYGFVQQENLHPLSSVFDWENYTPTPASSYSFNFPQSVSRNNSFGPRTYDYDNSLEIQTSSSWYPDNNGGVGSGSLAEFDYNGHDGINGNGSNTTFLQNDYCCDSGIGIDASSRAGFYDDVFPEYEGDYEYVGGGGTAEDAGIALQHGGFTTNDNDGIEYDHFQGSTYNSWSNSSLSGTWKQGSSKGHRRRAKVKPCKYFLLDGSCRRGRDCKFSHDLTTCRYWAEGSCLKGDSCPYLHCFLERSDFVGQGEYKHGKRYHLESENDFPTLSSTKANAMLSSRVPMSLEFPSGYEGEGDAVSSTESLLMLADPAGSIYDGFGSSFKSEGGGGGFLSRRAKGMDSNTWKNHNLEDHQKGPPETKRNCNSTRTIGKGGESGSSTPRMRQHGINKGNGQNNNNSSSWICSMISVKEKRKKKKY